MDHRELELNYHCYLCGRKIKEAEVIPEQDKQVCDICEARLEFEWNQAGKSKGLLNLRRQKKHP